MLSSEKQPCIIISIIYYRSQASSILHVLPFRMPSSLTCYLGDDCNCQNAKWHSSTYVANIVAAHGSSGQRCHYSPYSCHKAHQIAPAEEVQACKSCDTKRPADMTPWKVVILSGWQGTCCQHTVTSDTICTLLSPGLLVYTQVACCTWKHGRLGMNIDPQKPQE